MQLCPCQSVTQGSRPPKSPPVSWVGDHTLQEPPARATQAVAQSHGLGHVPHCDCTACRVQPDGGQETHQETQENIMKKQIWKYKDANREYWNVTAEPGTPSSAVHLQWLVTISRNHPAGERVVVFSEYVAGEYHDPIGLDECLLAWARDHSALIIGMAKYAKPSKHIK